MNKFVARKLVREEYQTYASLQCVVCGEEYGSNWLWYKDAVVYKNIIFVLPSNHEACQELFNLNPLAYETPREQTK
jgi:hypothetical protein